MKDDLQLGSEIVSTPKPGKFHSEGRYLKSRQKTAPQKSVLEARAVGGGFVNKLQRVHKVCVSAAGVGTTGFPTANQEERKTAI